MPPEIALAAPLHDPPGALAGAIAEGLPRLAALYRGVAVAVSPPTAPRVAALLAARGMLAGTTRTNLRGPLYRLAIRRALATGAARIHYLDLDRALRWVVRAPRALRAVRAPGARHGVLVLGRTPKAHRSHHLPLYATEALVNRLMTLILDPPSPLELIDAYFLLA